MNSALEEKHWPPDYTKEILARISRLKMLQTVVNGDIAAKAYYADHPIDFIEDWCITYDPRNASSKDIPTTMPFVLFNRQKEFVRFLQSCLEDKECGLVEKCRDVGATWLSCAFSVWLWIFIPGSAIGWGSRKEMLVDKLGDPDSIFEKIRKIIENLPAEFIPKGFNDRVHSSYMKLVNPETGSTITGEAGDNIGRGGRKLIYFKDESAHYEHPEKIEASLGDNTDVQIDISSVNGTGNIFYRRRQSGVLWPEKEAGKTRVFIFDWRDHPAKTQDWHDKREAKARAEGLMHIFAQEVERDYSSSMQGIVIPQKWVQAAIDAHIALGISTEGASIAGLDVADGGEDTTALSIRKGVILNYVDEWPFAEDVGVSTNIALKICAESGVTSLQYDCIGIGAGVKAESNRLVRAGALKRTVMEPWDAGSGVIKPDDHIIANDSESPINKDFYANLKAQAWWNLRRRFEKTYRYVVLGIPSPHDELISIDSSITKLHKLCNELSQPTFDYDGKGRIIINKKPNGSKSPNLSDSTVMNFFPVISKSFFA